MLYERTDKTLQQSAAVDGAAALEHRGGRTHFWNCSLPPHFPGNLAVVIVLPPSPFHFARRIVRQPYEATQPAVEPLNGGVYIESITFCGRAVEGEEKNSMETLTVPAAGGRVWWSVGKWWRWQMLRTCQRNVDGNWMVPALIEAMM